MIRVKNIRGCGGVFETGEADEGPYVISISVYDLRVGILNFMCFVTSLGHFKR